MAEISRRYSYVQVSQRKFFIIQPAVTADMFHYVAECKSAAATKSLVDTLNKNK